MRGMIVAAALLWAAPAAAQELRDLCPTRPGLGTSACIVDKGHVLGELGFADWTLDRTADQREDTVLIGDTLIRYGLTDTSEVQLGFTPYGHVRTRDRTTSVVEKQGRVGDATIAFRQNLRHPDGKGTAIAIEPLVTIPVGRQPVGAGDWGAVLLIPVDFQLGEKVQLQLSPRVDAAVDEDGHGRHLAYGSVVGVDLSVSDAIDVVAEVQMTRDRDPGQHVTEALGALSLAWKPRDDLQLDIGAIAGLNHNSPDIELSAGIARRF